MAESNVVPFPKVQRAPRKARLVRGIDEIPPAYEFLSSWNAIGELNRSGATLTRLADEAAAGGRRKDAAALRRCASAAKRGLDAITGGFETARLESLAARHPEVAEHFKRGA